MLPAKGRGMDGQIIYSFFRDWYSRYTRVGAAPTEALRLVRTLMKLRRRGVRIEDERGNPVSFLQLKEAAEQEAKKPHKSKGDGGL